ncbi:MAG: hemerythrin family protein [Pirellulales bacterium]|nr:hemerythrin family protein [Pirellulales bacterium]
MRILWNETLRTGIPDIDRQHQEFFRRTGEFYQRAAKHRTREEIVEMLDFLTRYAHEHFREEERWMDLHGCPAAEQNRVEHEEIVETVATLREMLREEGSTEGVAHVIEQRLLDWLAEHIARVDAQLRDYAPQTSVPAGEDAPGPGGFHAG